MPPESPAAADLKLEMMWAGSAAIAFCRGRIVWSALSALSRRSERAEAEGKAKLQESALLALSEGWGVLEERRPTGDIDRDLDLTPLDGKVIARPSKVELC